MKAIFTLILGLALAAPLMAQTELTEEGTATFKLAERAYNQGKYTEAIELYTEVLVGAPDYMNAYLRRGFCYSIEKNYEKCIEDLTVVINESPRNVFALTTRGSAYSKLKQYDKAIADFDTVLEHDSKNAEAYNNRGWAKKWSGDHEGACDDWKRSKKLGNPDAKLFLKENDC